MPPIAQHYEEQNFYSRNFDLDDCITNQSLSFIFDNENEDFKGTLMHLFFLQLFFGGRFFSVIAN